jgi:glycosyltransferase involved in cell wall biosynthesis
MRVALVYRSFHLGGSLPRTTVQLARHLSRGHDVHVFSIGSRTETSLAPRCTFHDVPVARVGDGRRFSARELASFARSAASRLARERFDVVHTCAPSTWVADVLHVPGVARDEAALQGIPGWRYAAAAVRHPGEAARRLLERKALGYGRLRRVHVAAPSVLDALAQRYGIAAEHVLVVPPSVSLDEFRPPDDKRASRIAVGIDDSNGLVLLFCGSDFHRKGLDRAIRALAGATAAPTAALLVVGGGDEAPYRRLAAQLGVGDRVTFLGPREDAWRFYQASDLVVLPTRADVWGVTPIEAMACGVPPLVSAAAGSASAIRDGETGIVLAEPLSVAALSAAIDALAADPQRRAAMGRAGIDAAKAHSSEARLQQVEEDLVAVAERRVGAKPIARSRGRLRRALRVRRATA